MTRMPKAKSAAIATLGGVDIGKSTFHLIGLDKRGAIALRERLSRAQIVEGRMRGGQLVPNKSREFLVQKGQGRLRPRQCLYRRRDAEVGVLSQQPGQDGRRPIS